MKEINGPNILIFSGFISNCSRVVFACLIYLISSLPLTLIMSVWDRWYDDDESDGERIFRTHSRGESVASSTSSVPLPQLVSSASTFGSVGLLTPQDSYQDLEAPEWAYDSQDEAWIAEVWRSHRLNVKEGKQPQRPIVRRSTLTRTRADIYDPSATIA